MYDDVNQIDLVNNLEVAKRILGNLNTPLDGMMRVRIGQVISEAINALKIVEEQRYV